MKSKKFSWNREDTVKFAKDALRVLAPYLIVIIPVLIDQLPKEWAYSAAVIYVLQRVRAAIELYKAGK
ncbi:MAG: hypothetical protein CV087_17405 [Candidatus Brocadia sp. WS118]|nr:MAG: hypothetical protein CV087_17405 [Candidatus Brocadia sp. WS118]